MIALALDFEFLLVPIMKPCSIVKGVCIMLKKMCVPQMNLTMNGDGEWPIRICFVLTLDPEDGETSAGSTSAVVRRRKTIETMSTLFPDVVPPPSHQSFPGFVKSVSKKHSKNKKKSKNAGEGEEEDGGDEDEDEELHHDPSNTIKNQVW